MVPKPSAHHTKRIKRPAPALISRDHKPIPQHIDRTDVHTSTQTTRHRTNHLIHRTTQIRRTHVESAHAALRLHENKPTIRKGDTNIVNRKPGLAADSLNSGRRIEPKARSDPCRRPCCPPSEHLRLEHHTAGSPGAPPPTRAHPAHPHSHASI